MSKTFDFQDWTFTTVNFTPATRRKLSNNARRFSMFGFDSKLDKANLKQRIAEGALSKLVSEFSNNDHSDRQTDGLSDLASYCDKCSSFIEPFCSSRNCHDNMHKDCEAKRDLFYQFPRFCTSCVNAAINEAAEEWTRIYESLSNLPAKYKESLEANGRVFERRKRKPKTPPKKAKRAKKAKKAK